jgi:carboxyl-terminal processing protease
MKKIVNFMKRKKGLILAMAFVFGGLFFAFTNNNTTDTSLEKRKKLLIAIGTLLEKQHYSPKKIDDAFSAEVFKKYLEEIDGEKNIFLQSDIVSLQKFQNTIDDEIHGSAIEFVPAVEKIYTKRIAEVIAIYQEILSKPFDFSVNESFISEASKLKYSLD